MERLKLADHRETPQLDLHTVVDGAPFHLLNKFEPASPLSLPRSHAEALEMDVHPTPFPGKRPPVANQTKKDTYLKSKSSKESGPTVAPSNYRSKRTFGVPRSTNISIEKPRRTPIEAKICRPWKPSGTSLKPGRRDGSTTALPEKPTGRDTSSSLEKSKGQAQKTQQVCFREPAFPVETEEVKSIEHRMLDDGVGTPVSLNKPMVPPSTPYHSAENCNKCRLDRLESSSYWLNQIKLAESVGKHSVSAAFFRLALECHAEPFLSLQNELKHYVKRHEAISMDTSWGDLCLAYRLPNDQTSVDLCNLDKIDIVLVEQDDPKSNIGDEEVNSEMHKDRCLEFVCIDNLPLDVSDEEPIKLGVLEEKPIELIGNSIVEFNDFIGKKEPMDATQCSCSPKDAHECGKKSTKIKDSRRDSYKKSCGSFNVASNDSSSRTKMNKSVGSADKAVRALNQTGELSKFSVPESARRNQVGGRVSRASQLRSKGKADEKGRSPLSGENVNHDKIQGDATPKQSS